MKSTCHQKSSGHDSCIGYKKHSHCLGVPSGRPTDIPTREDGRSRVHALPTHEQIKLVAPTHVSTAANPRRLPQIKATPSNPPTHSVRSSPSSLLASSVGSCLAQCDSGPHPRHTSRLEATYRGAPIHAYFLQRGLRFDCLKGRNESLGLANIRK